MRLLAEKKGYLTPLLMYYISIIYGKKSFFFKYLLCKIQFIEAAGKALHNLLQVHTVFFYFDVMQFC